MENLSLLRWEVKYPELLHQALGGARHEATRGAFNEVLGQHVVLPDARDRLIQAPARRWNIYSAVGQWLWLHEPMNLDGMTKYYEDGYQLHGDQELQIKVLGAYGPRLFGTGSEAQIEYIVARLIEKPNSRKAVGTIYRPDLDHEAIKEDEVPCTLGFQFLQRDDKLHMYVHMRSQDVWSMLPNDIFMFTMLQEYVANRIGCGLGQFHQLTGSSHVYDRHQEAAWRYVNDSAVRPGRQGMMMAMPADDLEESVRQLGELERRIRVSALAAMESNAASTRQPAANIQLIETLALDNELPPYWRQLGLLLGCYGAANAGAADSVRDLVNALDQPWLPHGRLLEAEVQKQWPSL